MHRLRVALLLGRGGSSLTDKNIRKVAGRPLLQWPAIAARNFGMDYYFASSEDDKILSSAQEVGYRSILRPSSLATDDARACDVISHAVGEIVRVVGIERFDILMQHANSPLYTEQKIAKAMQMFSDNPELTAIVPCYRVQDLHPYRLKSLDSDGLLKNFVSVPDGTSSNRQELPPVYALNHDFWLLRSENFLRESPGSQPPWNCMGGKIAPLFSEETRDVHNLEDLEQVERLLKSRATDE